MCLGRFSLPPISGCVSVSELTLRIVCLWSFVPITSSAPHVVLSWSIFVDRSRLSSHRHFHCCISLTPLEPHAHFSWVYNHRSMAKRSVRIYSWGCLTPLVGLSCLQNRIWPMGECYHLLLVFRPILMLEVYRRYTESFLKDIAISLLDLLRTSLWLFHLYRQPYSKPTFGNFPAVNPDRQHVQDYWILCLNVFLRAHLCAPVSFSAFRHRCCVWPSVSPLRYHYLPALRSMIITHFIATMADSAIHTPSPPPYALNTCAANTHYPAGECGLPRFLCLSLLTRWRSKPRWMLLWVSANWVPEKLLHAGIIKPSASTFAPFEANAFTLRFRLANFAVYASPYWLPINGARLATCRNWPSLHDGTFTRKIGQTLPGAP